MSMISQKEFQELPLELLELKDGQQLSDALKPGDDVALDYTGYYVRGAVEAIGTDGKIKVNGDWETKAPAVIYRVVKGVSRKGDGVTAKAKDS